MDIPTHESIENAYKQAKEVTERLPESTESRRAQEHLGLAEKYVHEARDRSKPDRSVEIDASVEMRGPAMTGWPFRSRMTVWCWTDGSAP
jgi:hypothetical protein